MNEVTILKCKVSIFNSKLIILNDKDVVLVALARMNVRGERVAVMASAKAGSTPYTDAAQALIKDTHAMRTRIPKFVIPSEGDGRRLAPAGSVPPQFIEQTVVARDRKDDLDTPLARPREKFSGRRFIRC